MPRRRIFPSRSPIGARTGWAARLRQGGGGGRVGALQRVAALWGAYAGPSPALPGAPAAGSGCWRRGWCSPRRRNASAVLLLPAMPKLPWYMLTGGGHGSGGLPSSEPRRTQTTVLPGAFRLLPRCCGRVQALPVGLGLSTGWRPLGTTCGPGTGFPWGRGRL